jgi:hypothetical protein
MNENQPDIARMRKDLAAIREHPDNHDQSRWVGSADDVTVASGLDQYPPCGTTLCFAGWDAYLHAPKGSRLVDGVYIMYANGGHDSISKFAQEGMGISKEQAAAFFTEADSADDLETMINTLEANPDATWGDLSAARRHA